jgi:prepilin-type N-terminal cleavage/methylation domain-containing protein
MKGWQLTLMRKNKTAFTLVELLMAMTISSLIAAGVIFSFLAGLRIWDRAQNTDVRKTERLLSLEQLARELRQSVNVSAIGFQGGQDEFSFPTPINDKIVKVTCKLDSGKKTFVRGIVSLSDIIRGKEAEGYSQKPLFALDDLRLEYYYYDRIKAKYEWKDAWSKDDGAFIAVRLHLIINNEDYVKTIFIPYA